MRQCARTSENYLGRKKILLRFTITNPIMISITQTKRYVSLMGQRMTVSLCCTSKGQSNPLEISGGRSKLSLFVDFCPPNELVKA